MEPVHRHRGHVAISEAIAAVAATIRTEHAIVGEVYRRRTAPALPAVASPASPTTGVQHEDQMPDVVWHLRYDDEYQLTDAGWRISRRALTIDAIETRPVRRVRL